ncbi:MAG: hypothetical protein MI866_01370, partial [Bacteroidales bacterium]|nr:hypothetical protein [Bacteroidales bacterium]
MTNPINKFTKVVSSYTDSHLADIVNNREDYVDEMILASINELENRQLNKSESKDVKAQIEKQIQSKQ